MTWKKLTFSLRPNIFQYKEITQVSDILEAPSETTVRVQVQAASYHRRKKMKLTASLMHLN